MAVRLLVLIATLLAPTLASAQLPVVTARPLGTAAAVSEIVRLRREKAQIEAQLIGRDRQMANLRYQLQKQILELQADLDEARLNARAVSLLPSLRELFKPQPTDIFDWQKGVFVSPPTKETPPPSETKEIHP